jgi:phosphatidylinositol dimannoside acyltransferase
MSRYRGSGRPGAPVDRNPGAAERLPPDPRSESLGLRARGVLWAVAWELSRRLPERLVFRLADVLARRLARRAGADHQLRRNLARVVEPAALDDAVEAGFRSYARYWVEAFRAADLDPADLDRRTTTAGFELMDEVLDEGGGAIVLLAHHGSWDVAAHWGETHGYHLAVVAEVVRPRRMFEKFVRLRETVGLEVVPLRRGEALVTRLEEVLADNHMVGLLAERDLSGRAPVVRLFGEEARLPRGPVLLAQRTGTPVVPVALLQRPQGRWHFQVLAPLRLDGLPFDDAAQRVAAAIEEIIRLDPAQWHAFQPVWRTELRARRSGAAAAAGRAGRDGAAAT